MTNERPSQAAASGGDGSATEIPVRVIPEREAIPPARSTGGGAERSGPGAAPAVETIDPRAAITAIREAAHRMGIEMDEQEATEWLAAMAASTSGVDVVVDAENNVYGHRVSMLDFRPDELERFREIGRIVGLDDRPGVATALALSGSAAQSKIQRYPGDCDYFERVHITAPTRLDACRVLADVVRDKALAAAVGPNHRLSEVKFGSYPVDVIRDGSAKKAGSSISWSADEIRAGRITVSLPDGSPATIGWFDAAREPGWCKLDWIVADPRRRTVANASNMLDVTWEAPDGTVVPLDGFLDPYFQEVYLEAESLPVFYKVAKQLSADALDRHVDDLEREVRKYLTEELNYGKAARRLYNLFRLTGRYEEAAYLRELFDEPSTVLYRIWSLVRSLEEAARPGSTIDDHILVGQVDELIMDAVRTLEGDAEVAVVSHLLRLRDSLVGRGHTAGAPVASTVAEDIRGARLAAMDAVNAYFRDRLTALPAIRTYLESATTP